MTYDYGIFHFEELDGILKVLTLDTRNKASFGVESLGGGGGRMAQSAPQAELPKGEAAFKFLENILAPLPRFLEASKRLFRNALILA